VRRRRVLAGHSQSPGVPTRRINNRETNNPETVAVANAAGSAGSMKLLVRASRASANAATRGEPGLPVLIMENNLHISRRTRRLAAGGINYRARE